MKIVVVGGSGLVGLSRWASTRGRGGCSRPPAITGWSSLTRTLGTTARSCTAASWRRARAPASGRVGFDTWFAANQHEAR